MTKRRRPGNRPLATIFHLCIEGEVTEKTYFSSLNSSDYLKGKITFRIHKTASDPYRLVESAVELKNSGNLEEADQIWCVFDVEYPNPHGKLADAVELAELNDITIAVSNPSFEVWLLLHHGIVTKHLSSDEAKRLQRGRPDPASTSYYLPRLADARSNARSLVKKHQGDGKGFLTDNPTSHVFEIFEQIDKILGK
jgi:hypothetical protein